MISDTSCSVSLHSLLAQDKVIKNADEATVNAQVLRLQSDMAEACGATNIGSASLTQQFLAKSSDRDAEGGEDAGVFSGSLARLGGIRAFAQQASKDT